MAMCCFRRRRGSCVDRCYSIVRKMDVRLLPTTALVYLLCYIDRSNIGEWLFPPSRPPAPAGDT